MIKCSQRAGFIPGSFARRMKDSQCIRSAWGGCESYLRESKVHNVHNVPYSKYIAQLQVILAIRHTPAWIGVRGESQEFKYTSAGVRHR